MLDNRPTVGSLFSGIGGIDLGLERVGFRTAWFCERDEWCQKILHKHWPGVHCYGDIHDIDEHAPSVDVLAGGFPCQPVSVAGKRLAQDDPRWLWPEFWRLIRILRPRAALLENVPGLFSAGFGNILSDLAASGYDAEWDCIPAAAVGAPHRRDRVFIIATSRAEFRRHMADGDDTGSFDTVCTRGDAIRDGSAVMADPAFMFSNGGDNHAGINKQSKEVPESGNGRGPENVADPDNQRCDRGARGQQGRREQSQNGSGGGPVWAVEPAVGRVAHGIPRRVDRLRGLGNAVVPQVAEVVGRRVMEILRGN